MNLRFGESTANGYTKRMFVDAWSRYRGVSREPEERQPPHRRAR